METKTQPQKDREAVLVAKENDKTITPVEKTELIELRKVEA